MTAADPSTIAALATPAGVGGIAVIRVSGPQALAIGTRLTGFTQARFKDRYALFAPIRDDSGSEIDRGVITFFQGPHSYTGEDVLEISTHGGMVIPKRTLEACLRLGCSPAQPGEFTKRAFLNGKMDLSQAEAVADVISAKTALSQDVSYRILSGNFSTLIHEMKQQLLHVVSLVESELDFGDDEITPTPPVEKSQLMGAVLDVANRLISTYSTGRLLREGAIVSIIGKPNVGKSSLLNALISEERVIVTDQAGTTRDAVEVYYQIEGFPIRFIDTAGLRSTDNPVELLGIEFSRRFIDKSDLILWVFDTDETDTSIRTATARPFFRAPYLLILNKADLHPGHTSKSSRFSSNGGPPIVVSALEKTGIPSLVERIHQTLVSSGSPPSEVLLTNARHKDSLQNCVSSLARAQQLVADGGPGDLTAFELREALSHLDKILGVTTADDILNNIFATFCVGK